MAKEKQWRTYDWRQGCRCPIVNRGTAGWSLGQVIRFLRIMFLEVIYISASRGIEQGLDIRG